MKIIKKYSEINKLSTELEQYLKNEFREIHSMCSNNKNLLEYDLDVIGEFVVIEDQSELSNLKCLGYHGSVTDQIIEFVEKVQLNALTFYDVCVIRDTDGGTRFIVDRSILNNTLKEFFNKETIKW